MKIIIAAGPVIVENKKVLLNKHGDTTFWKFCGGKVKDYEINLIETAKREAKEEMGIDIEISDKEPFIVHTKKETEDGEVDVILVHYLAKRVGEITPNKEIDEWKWIPLKDIEKEELGPNIIPALVHYWFLDK